MKPNGSEEREKRGDTSFTFDVSKLDRDLIRAAAGLSGQSMAAWAREVLSAAARKQLAEGTKKILEKSQE